MGTYLVLLVEDEPVCRKLFSRYLEHAGYRVLPAENGIEALRIFFQAKEHGQCIHCVVTDMKMPHMEGSALATHLRKEMPELPIVFLTGDPHDPLLANERVLEKPTQLMKLAACLQSLLS